MALTVLNLTTLLLFLFSSVQCDRKVSAELNPGCLLPDCKNNNVMLVHVKAEGSNDTLHHLWDFTGKPSLLLALTETNATFSVEWQSFSLGAEGTVKFYPAPKYMYGVVVDKLIEFNDTDDSGALNQTINTDSYVRFWDTKNFNWKLVDFKNTSNPTLTVESTQYYDTRNTIKKNGTVRIVMSAFGGEDHADTLPHLLHSGNASQFDLTLENLERHYTNSRFGLNIITASTELNNRTTEIKSRKTMDDEHAPGVFTIVEMVSPTVLEEGCGGYLQWRPVVYTTSAREMSKSTDTVQYSVVAPEDPIVALTHTLLCSAFGNKLAESLVAATNVTFGSAMDGFYRKNNYATWTMLVGYGHPPEEQFSMLVTLVLLIGLGLPAVLILVGTVCIVMRRLQRNKDDLFLSR